MPESAPEETASVRVRSLLYGRLLSRVLCAVTELGVVDMLGDHTLAADELARRCGMDEQVLRRMLRSLSAFEVFRCVSTDNYQLGCLGHALRSTAALSAAPTALLAAEPMGQAWDEFSHTLRTGEPGFDKAFRTDFYTYLAAHPQMRQRFDRSQIQDVAAEAGALTRSFYADGGTVADVGGGDGLLLEKVLLAFPTARGILLDEVTDGAARRFEAAGLAPRCVVHTGDFFTYPPPAADFYLFRHVLHNLADERCVLLLRRYREAMPDEAVLIVIERILARTLDTTPGDQFIALMDLYMLTVFGRDGQERSLDQFRDLFDQAGLVVKSIADLGGAAAALTVVPQYSR